LERFGEKFKKILDLDLNDGLEAFTIRGNKLFALITKWEENKTLIVHYDIKNDTITLIKEIPNIIYLQEGIFFNVSDNFDFFDIHRYFYKYDKNANDYITIDTGIDRIFSYSFLENKILVLGDNGFNVLDYNGNVLTTIPVYGDAFTYDKISNKAYLYYTYVSYFYEIDLNTYEYREIGIPQDIAISYGISLRRIPNTNFILLVCSNTKKVWKFNLDTLELTQVFDFSGFREVNYAYISEDCKRIYLSLSLPTWRFMYETYVYDVEKNTFEFLLSTQYPYYIIENVKANKLIIVDAPAYLYTFIIDLKTKRVEACVSCNGNNTNWTDGNLIFTI
jgi:hypothetical protein